MKRIPSTVTVSLIFLLGWNGWTTSGRAQAVDPIVSIRQQYAAINKRAPRLRKVKKELSGFSLEGGELVAYFDGPAIVKMVATHYGEGGRTVEEYYYSGGKLIFLFEKVLHYDRPMSGKVVRSAENRYYFASEKLVRWIDEKGKQAPGGSEQFEEKQSEALEYSTKFLNGARSPQPTIEAETQN